MHVYGEPARGLRDACGEVRVPLYVAPWTPRVAAAGLAHGAAYLVRPDGYVALAGCAPDDLAPFLARVTARR